MLNIVKYEVQIIKMSLEIEGYQELFDGLEDGWNNHKGIISRWAGLKVDIINKAKRLKGCTAIADFDTFKSFLRVNHINPEIV